MAEPALRVHPPSAADAHAASLSEHASWLAAGWSGGSAADNRHSRRVALLKRVLPAIGLGLLLLIAVWPRLAPLWERMRFASIDLREARELKMVDPRYAGIDRLGRPYVLTAASGRQVPDRQDLISLQAPRADMKTHSGAEIVVTAATGVYQSQTQLLDLMRDVTLTHQNGTRFVTAAARVDAAGNTAQGDAPVEGHGPSGDVKAQGFRILDKGDTILFTGKSDLRLTGAKAASVKSSPAALPHPVAVAAARAEVEAKPALTAAARKQIQHPAAHRRAAATHPRPQHPRKAIARRAATERN